MEIARRYQSNILEGLKVGYSGTEGAFAHIAASKIFPTSRKIAYAGFKKAYEAVERGECDCAVLPVETVSYTHLKTLLDKRKRYI